MANRYWVGGSANWDGTAGTKWATTSGGAGGASVPTSADTVYFDANSGSAVAVSIQAGNLGALKIDATNFLGLILQYADIAVGAELLLSNIYTPSGAWISYSGSLIIGSSGNVGKLQSSNSGFKNIVVNTGTISAGVELLDDLITTQDLIITSGYFKSNGYRLDIYGKVSSSNSFNRSIDIQSSLIRLLGTGVIWDLATSTNLTLYASGSSLEVESTLGVKTFNGGGKTYYNLYQAGAGALIISGSNTFNQIQNFAYPTTLTLTSGTTQTVNDFQLNSTGGPGNWVILNSTTPGVQATISKSSGTVTAYSCFIQDSNATGGATWNTFNCTSVSNNSGWIFDTVSNGGGFMEFF
jgi:hypothetical protein